jgi:DNA-directed RNA polymerase subunit beta'
MAVHLPLSIEAQTEAHVLMLAPNNIFSPQSGSPIITPSQDIVLGTFYITSEREKDKGEFKLFNSSAEALMAYELGEIAMHSRVFVRLTNRTHVVPDEKSGASPIEEISKKHLEEHRKRLNPEYVAKEEKKPKKLSSHVILTTVGRCIFNDILPKGMPFYNFALTAKGSSRVIADTYAELGRPATIDLLDDMKMLGFRRSTLAGLSFGITDIRSPDSKQSILDEGQKKADKIEKQYNQGAITAQERYSALIDVWGHARKQVTEDLMAGLSKDFRDDDGKPVPVDHPNTLRYLNPIAMMAISGARGNVDQIRQLGGMRGLMAKPSGEIIETPIKSNFR